MSERDALLGPQKAQKRSRPTAQASSSCCSFCVRGPLDYADISTAAEEAVDQLITELSVAPSTDSSRNSLTGGRDAGMVDALQRIWMAVAADANDSFPTSVPKVPNKEWRRLGFQGDDPCTDTRGTGVCGFTYLARLCEEYAHARAIGAGEETEMPLGIGAINVMFMLRCHLLLCQDIPSFCPCCGVKIREEYSTKQPHGGRHIRGFAMLLLDEPDAFFHLYALAVIVTATVWRKRFGTGRMPTSAVLRIPSAATTGSAKSRAASGHSVSASTSQSMELNGGGGGVLGDPRLMEFPQVLHLSQEIILEALAAFPPDLTSLRTALFKRLKSLPAHEVSVSRTDDIVEIGSSGFAKDAREIGSLNHAGHRSSAGGGAGGGGGAQYRMTTATESVPGDSVSVPQPADARRTSQSGRPATHTSPAAVAATRYGSKRYSAPVIPPFPTPHTSSATGTGGTGLGSSHPNHTSYLHSTPHRGIPMRTGDNTSQSAYKMDGSDILEVEDTM